MDFYCIYKNTRKLIKKLRKMGYLDNTCDIFRRDKFILLRGDNYYSYRNIDKLTESISKGVCIHYVMDEETFLKDALINIKGKNDEKRNIHKR